MLAYAADAPRFAERRRSPSALIAIVGLHAVALAALMATKMEVIRDPFNGTEITFVDEVEPPPEVLPPPPEVSEVVPLPTQSHIEIVPPVVPIDPIGPPVVAFPIPLPPLGPIAGGGAAA